MILYNFNNYNKITLNYLYKIKKQLIDNKQQKWSCIDAFEKRLKLDKSVNKILVHVSADNYKEMKLSFKLLNKNQQHEQNTLFASVRYLFGTVLNYFLFKRSIKIKSNLAIY